jgi:hypothetical protein
LTFENEYGIVRRPLLVKAGEYYITLTPTLSRKFSKKYFFNYFPKTA